MEFSPKKAIKSAKNNNLENWVYKFLTTKGGNKKLANIMKGKGVLIGPKKTSLNKLTRACGPEKDMKFHEDKKIWDKKINKMVKSIKKGWNPPPIIVWDMKNELSIADGSHRIEAFKKVGIKSYWTIIWQKSKNYNP